MVSANDKKSMQCIARFLVKQLAKEENCSLNDATLILLKTKTYQFLQDKETGFYAESREYIWNKLQEERRGNPQALIAP